ncbi:MAG: DUF3179 domain-containing (seleno)protein [Xenococcaceae cyanobacterium]
MVALAFDPNRLHKQPDLFARFDVSDEGVSISQAKLPTSAELIVFERRGERRALLVQEMAYHHLAQGELAEAPYIVSFCGVCHSGAGMTPLINGKVHHFKVGGLYNGVAILTDDETGTYWDHITGQAVYGPLEGMQLDIWSLEMTTAKAALLQEPDLKILRSYQRPVVRRVMGLGQWMFGKTGFLPKMFTQTMEPEDPRLPRMTMGLGVVVKGKACFYPVEAIQQPAIEEWDSKLLHIALNKVDGVPYAMWEDGTRPLQFFLRWYGFALTFPNCSIYLDLSFTHND